MQVWQYNELLAVGGSSSIAEYCWNLEFYLTVAHFIFVQSLVSCASFQVGGALCLQKVDIEVETMYADTKYRAIAARRII